MVIVIWAWFLSISELVGLNIACDKSRKQLSATKMNSYYDSILSFSHASTIIFPRNSDMYASEFPENIK